MIFRILVSVAVKVGSVGLGMQYQSDFEACVKPTAIDADGLLSAMGCILSVTPLELGSSGFRAAHPDCGFDMLSHAS